MKHADAIRALGYPRPRRLAGLVPVFHAHCQTRRRRLTITRKLRQRPSPALTRAAFMRGRGSIHALRAHRRPTQMKPHNRTHPHPHPTRSARYGRGLTSNASTSTSMPPSAAGPSAVRQAGSLNAPARAPYTSRHAHLMIHLAVSPGGFPPASLANSAHWTGGWAWGVVALVRPPRNAITQRTPSARPCAHKPPLPPSFHRARGREGPRQPSGSDDGDPRWSAVPFSRTHARSRAARMDADVAEKARRGR